MQEAAFYVDEVFNPETLAGTTMPQAIFPSFPCSLLYQLCHKPPGSLDQQGIRLSAHSVFVVVDGKKRVMQLASNPSSGVVAIAVIMLLGTPRLFAPAYQNSMLFAVLDLSGSI
jgi:hypothetical protein